MALKKKSAKKSTAQKTSKKNKSSYYDMQYSSEDPDADELAVIVRDSNESDDDLEWHQGEKFKKEVKLPVRLLIYKGDQGNGELPDFCDVPLPVMSKKLMAVLKKCGVKNIDFYEAEIFDENTKKTIKTHVAFNVKGRQSAKGGSLKFFRLKESINILAVDNSVKTAIEKGNFKQILFEPIDG